MTEQTRDWERGERTRILTGIRAYSKWAGALMVVAVPVFFIAMPGSSASSSARVRRCGDRRPRRPDRRGRPVPDGVDEDAAGHHRTAAATDHHAWARDARGHSARRRAPRGRVGATGAAVAVLVSPSCSELHGSWSSCACATRCRPTGEDVAAAVSRRRLRDLAARPRGSCEPRARLADFLADRGHNVEVVTTADRSPRGAVPGDVGRAPVATSARAGGCARAESRAVERTSSTPRA